MVILNLNLCKLISLKTKQKKNKTKTTPPRAPSHQVFRATTRNNVAWSIGKSNVRARGETDDDDGRSDKDREKSGKNLLTVAGTVYVSRTVALG